MRLSLIDLYWPGHLLRLINEAERLGYYRFWATEHHSAGQSSSPSIVTAIAASKTARLRVGTAAILLRYQSPLRIAEDFSLLELLFPRRIDLGLTSATLPEALGAALTSAGLNTDATYRMKAQQLVDYIRIGSFCSSGHSYPVDLGSGTRPEIWICGTSLASAALAGELGVSYAYHHYWGIQRLPKNAASPDAINCYRDTFQPNNFLAAPQYNITASGIRAENELDASFFWREELGCPRTPSFLGSPEQCRDQLLDLSRIYGTDEIVIQSVARNFTDRLGSYQLLADIFSLLQI